MANLQTIHRKNSPDCSFVPAKLSASLGTKKAEGRMTKHPLDPLGPDEMTRVVEIIRKQGELSPKTWFETIALHEPLKEHLRQGNCPRLAYACCYDPEI